MKIDYEQISGGKKVSIKRNMNFIGYFISSLKILILFLLTFFYLGSTNYQFLVYLALLFIFILLIIPSKISITKNLDGSLFIKKRKGFNFSSSSISNENLAYSLSTIRTIDFSDNEKISLSSFIDYYQYLSIQDLNNISNYLDLNPQIILYSLRNK